MEAIASKPLDPVWKDRLSLSARVAPEFYETSDDVGNVPHAGALRTTLDDLGGSAVFCVQDVPTVVILSVDEYNPAAVASLCPALWNQGLASLLVVLSEDTVRVFSLARIPRSGDEDAAVTPCLVEQLRAAADALALRNLVYAAESGRYWEEHPDHFRPEDRVDRVLLDNLTQSHKLLCAEGLSADAAQALLMQTMFVAWLEDREIVVGGYFRYVPIELISAVHDRFLAERGPDRRTSGAYYTPMFLADTAVSHAWDRLPPAVRDAGRFLDPACGSGIFLVRLFQRLCEHRRAGRRDRKIPWNDLLDVLSRLQGRDVDGGAVRVAVFSLYVALLEEVTPPDVRALMKRGRMLPALHGETLRHEDFFAAEADDAPADVIVGNPPWSSRQGEGHSALEWCRQEGLPAPGQEQAWAFVWKSLRHLREDGVVALLLPAMGFLHNHAGDAVEARKRLLREAQIFAVVNFADLRFQLFDHAVRPAALVLFGRPPAGGAAYRFDYLTPKADLNLKSRRLITIGGADRCQLDSRMVEADPSVFKKRLWLSEPEARLFNYLSQFPRLGVERRRSGRNGWHSSHCPASGSGTARGRVAEFGKLSRRKESIQGRWVVGQGFKPVNVDLLRHPAYKREHSSVVAATPFLPTDEFRVLARTSEGLKPWKDGAVHRRGFEAGFAGPRVLVPQGVAAGAGRGGPRLRAAYVEAPMTFRHIVQAIVVPPGDERRGMLLAGLLNSRLMLWFAFHGTSSFGSDRPKVHQAELLRLPFPAPDDLPEPERSRAAADALTSIVEKQVRRLDPAPVQPDQTAERGVFDEIDDLAYKFFCLSEEERILVEDTVEHVIPAVQPNRGRVPTLWRPSTRDDRHAYARTLASALADWLDGDGSIGTRLVARNDDLAILQLSLRAGPGAFDYVEDDDESVAEALSRLAEHVHEPLPGNFQALPDFRVFAGRDLFLVKPAGKRFWLRSAALADANAIVIDLHMWSNSGDGRAGRL